MIQEFHQSVATLAEFLRRQDGGQFVQTLWRPASEVTPKVTPEVARLLRVEGGPFSRQELQDQLILDALNDGFRAEIVSAAEHLYHTDPHKSGSDTSNAWLHLISASSERHYISQ